jgi:hypothetical protein
MQRQVGALQTIKNSPYTIVGAVFVVRTFSAISYPLPRTGVSPGTVRILLFHPIKNSQL